MAADEKRMTFTEHLAELRTCIIRSGLAVLVGFIVCYVISDQIFALIARPLRPLAAEGILQADPPSDQTNAEAPAEPAAPSEAAPKTPSGRAREATWTVLNPLEGFLVKLKLAGYFGVLLAFPIIVWQICAFVFPGLRDNEKRAVQVLIGGCSALGCAGVAVAYFGVFPLLLPYLLQWTPEGVEVQLRMSETLSIIIKGLVGFAIAFQFPMAVLILVYMGLLSPETLKKYRRVAIVGIAIASAVFTPPDPLSMIIMMFPLLILYEISIWASYLVLRRKKKAQAET